jgi:hypothetical protein
MEESFSCVDVSTRRIIYLNCQGVRVNTCKGQQHEIQEGELDTDQTSDQDKDGVPCVHRYDPVYS